MVNSDHCGEIGGIQPIIVDNAIDDDEVVAEFLNAGTGGEEQCVTGSDSGPATLDHHGHPYFDQDKSEDPSVSTSASAVHTTNGSGQSDAPSLSAQQQEEDSVMVAVSNSQTSDLEEDDRTVENFTEDDMHRATIDESSQDRDNVTAQPECSTPKQDVAGKEFHSENHPSATNVTPLFLESPQSDPNTSYEELVNDLCRATTDTPWQEEALRELTPDDPGWSVTGKELHSKDHPSAINVSPLFLETLQSDPNTSCEELVNDLCRATMDTPWQEEALRELTPDDPGWSVTGKEEAFRSKMFQDSRNISDLAGLASNLRKSIDDKDSPRLNMLASHLVLSIDNINQAERDEMEDEMQSSHHYMRPMVGASGNGSGAGSNQPNKITRAPLLSDLERAWCNGQEHTNLHSPLSTPGTDGTWGMENGLSKDAGLKLNHLGPPSASTLSLSGSMSTSSRGNSQTSHKSHSKSVPVYDRASQEQAGWGSLEDVDFVIPWYTRVGRVTMCFLFPSAAWFILWRWLNWVPAGIFWADFLSASFMIVEGISLGFASTAWLWMWNLKYRKRVTMEELNLTDYELPTVDILIPCYSEPPEIVEMTLKACYELDYPAHKVCCWICDDGKSDEMKAMVDHAKRFYTGAMQTKYVARIKIPGVPHHAKAGNLNNVILNEGSTGQLIMVLDCDMLPEPCFPRTIAPFFFNRLPEGTPKYDEEGGPIRAQLDPDMGLIQTPQAFYNIDRKDLLGQNYAFFYECVMSGWDGSGCTPCCGTGVVFARPAMETLGGFSVGSITEDFKTSLNFCANGYKCKYYLKRMTRGVAPKELNAFMIQRMRWAVGSVQILKAKNPLFMKGLPWRARLLYFFSTIGCIYVLFIALIMIILYFAILTGAPLSFGPVDFLHYLAVGAIPIFLGSSMQFITSWRLSWNDYVRGMQDNFTVFWTLLRSMVIGFCNLKLGFAVTAKDVSFDLKVNLYHAMPHIIVYIVSAVAMIKGTIELLAASGYFSIPWTTDHNVDMIYFSWFWTLFLWYMLSGVPRMVWYGYRRSKKEEASAKRGVYCTNSNVPALQELPSSPMGTFPPLSKDLVSFKVNDTDEVKDQNGDNRDMENDRITNAMLQAKFNEELRILNEAIEHAEDI